MFRGMNEVNLDSKGRLTLPTRFREIILEMDAGKMVVTIDVDETCLLLYPATTWETIEKKLEALPSFNPAARRIQRLFIGHASEVTLDSNGRLLIGGPLRNYAKLEKKSLLVGQGKKFEIWNESVWNEKRENWLQDEDVKAQLPDDLLNISL